MKGTYYWQLRSHINGGDRHIRVEQCPELGICRQTVTLRKGWRIVEQLHFFADETATDDPVYSLREILREAEYRKALREQDALELEAIAQGAQTL